jgi:hypothetical protein
MTKIILPLESDCAEAIWQHDADQAILDKALKEQAEEILDKLDNQCSCFNMLARVVRVADCPRCLEALRASYLGGTK